MEKGLGATAGASAAPGSEVERKGLSGGVAGAALMQLLVGSKPQRPAGGGLLRSPQDGTGGEEQVGCGGIFLVTLKRFADGAD